MTTAIFDRVQEQFYPASPIKVAEWEVEIESIERGIDRIDEHPGWDEDGDIATVATALHQLQSRLDAVADVPYRVFTALTKRIRTELEAIEITDTVIDDNGMTQVVVVGYCNPYLETTQSDMGDEF